MWPKWNAFCIWSEKISKLLNSNNNNTSFAVAEAQARIHDTKGGDIMVKRGSTIELNCTVESGDRAHHSLAVFWYLEDRVIDWMGQTGHGRGVQVSQQERLPIVTSIWQILWILINAKIVKL